MAPSTSPIQLSYVDSAGALRVLEIDAFLSEQHHHTAMATQFPVETGALVSDHVIQEPDVVRLEVLATDTPLPSSRFGEAISPEEFDLLSADPGRGRKSQQYPGRGRDVYRQVVELKEAGTAVVLTSTVHTYENMVIESVELPVDASRGDAAQFSVSLRKVQQVGLRTVAVPKIEKASGKASKGKVAPVAADPKPDSLARAAAKRAGYVPPVRP